MLFGFIKVFYICAVLIHVKLIKGMCIMYDELVKKRIIIEFENLINSAKDENNDVDSYAQFMKEVILNTYGVN